VSDRIQILINAILSKTTPQELEQELKRVEKNLKPLDLKLGINEEAQIKLHKSIQKMEKEQEKISLDTEKRVLKANAEKEKQL
jgi:cob(I)alamin adenosyltransferase